MKIVQIGKRLIVQTEVIRGAVRVLRAGGVIAYPTETTYGLGCDPRNAKAVKRIYAIKGREKKKPLLLVAADMAQARRVADVSMLPSRLKCLWPGPVTFVLPSKNGKGDVAVRVSSSRFVQRLTKAYGNPIIATSANKSGEPDCRSGRAVERAFRRAKNRPDLILDMGSLPRRKSSTVARIKPSGKLEVLRQGAVRLSSV